MVDADAVIGPDVVVGAGAHVAAGARLERAVVWPGAAVTGAVADAVVTPSGTVGV